MTSRRSASSSRPSKTESLKRSRALARGGIRFEALADEHIKYAWAAYKTGVFKESFEEGLEPIDFAAKFISTANTMMDEGSLIIVATADTPRGNVPVVMIILDGNDRVVWPGAHWFPNASPRNKIEIGVRFFRDIKKDHVALVTAREKDAGYYRHLGKYGLLRQIGKIRDYHAIGDDAILFQTVGS